MIPGENISAAYGERKRCWFCQVEIVQLFDGKGKWIHVGRHHYENSEACPPLTVATPEPWSTKEATP